MIFLKVSRRRVAFHRLTINLSTIVKVIGLEPTLRSVDKVLEADLELIAAKFTNLAIHQ